MLFCNNTQKLVYQFKIKYGHLKQLKNILFIVLSCLLVGFLQWIISAVLNIHILI